MFETLGKILTANQAKKSAQFQNQGEKQIQQELITTDCHQDETSGTRPEAEVRLVVRFIVEEQIVYKGKIERVQQLESEELSRVVSRVAWDGSKENQACDKANIDNLTHREPSAESERDKDQTSTEQAQLSQSQPNDSSLQVANPTSDSAPTETSVNSTNSDSSEPNSKPKTSNTQSSDHEAYIKSKSPSPEKTFENSVAQVNYPMDRPKLDTTDCDNQFNKHALKPNVDDVERLNCSPKQQSPPIINSTTTTTSFLVKDKKQLQNSPKSTGIEPEICIAETQLKPCITKQITSLETDQDENYNSESKVDNVSQSIAETLSECVHNVEIEVRHQAIMDARENLIAIEKPKMSSEIQDELAAKKQRSLDIGLPGISKEKLASICMDIVVGQTTQTVNDTRRKPSSEANLFDSNKVVEENIESADNWSKDKNVTENGTPVVVTQKISTETTVATNNTNSNTNTGKRKSVSGNDHASPVKRIRKSISKEQKKSTTRKSSSSSSSSSSINRIGPNTACKNNTTNSGRKISLIPDRQEPLGSATDPYIRHSKIFAKWTDNHYYPGTILRPANDRKYLICFLDNAQKNIAECDLIPLANIIGRQVRVSIAKNYCANALVHDQRSSVNDQPMFDVEYQQDGLVRKCVPLKDIFLTGEQGNLLLNQIDKNSAASNFADVDLDNIIYEKRSKRLQDVEEYELTENNSSTNGSSNNSSSSKRKRGQYNMRNANSSKIKLNSSIGASPDFVTGNAHNSPAFNTNQPQQQQKARTNSQSENNLSQDNEDAENPDLLKTNFLCPNSNPPSEGSNSTTGSSNVPNVLELGQEFYFTSSSPHRTKTSLLL